MHVLQRRLDAPVYWRKLGATVYKIEREIGDDQRTQGVSWELKFKTDIDDAAFDCGGFNRKWVSLNLKTEKSMEAMLKLLSDADVFHYQ